jgi:hypothetical protein
MIVFQNGKIYLESKYDHQDEMKEDILYHSKLFFGQNAIFVNATGRLESRESERAMPYGFLFDFSDSNEPKLYLVQVEISSHDFYAEIFPRVTRLFLLLKNGDSLSEISNEVLSLIDSSKNLKGEFDRHSGNSDTDQTVKDLMGNCQNLLLIVDGEKREFCEIVEAYKDTWGKTLRPLILRKFVCGREAMYILDPAFNSAEPVCSDSPANLVQRGGTDSPEESHLSARAQTVWYGPANKDTTRKVSLSKVGGTSNTLGDTVIGWETAPPRENEPYRIYLGNGKVLRTSPVKLITDTNDLLCIMTVNSLYEFRILEPGKKG